MLFYEYQTWQLKNVTAAEEGKGINALLTYVGENKKLFGEIAGARYYEQCDREGKPNGVYVLLLAYESKEAMQALKARIEKGRDGAYGDFTKLCAAVLSLDANIKYMEPLNGDLWFDYDGRSRAVEKANGVHLKRFIEYEIWRVDPNVDWKGYENMIETWFKYVVEKKKELFGEWISGSYYQQCDENGKPSGVYVMIFEYDSIEGHHAYKSRKLHSYALNDGQYAQYARNDPYQFFDLNYVNIDCMQEEQIDSWIR